MGSFSQALAVLYSDTRAATYSERVLATLKTLFDCEFASFSLLDLRRGSFHTDAQSSVLADWPGTAVHQLHFHTDPAANHIRSTGTKSAVKISDFVSMRQYRNLSIYTEVFRRVGCDRRMGYAVQDGGPVTMAATINRRRKDFSEEDRALLDLLRPHFLQAHKFALAEHRLQAERAGERAALGDLFDAGLGEISSTGRILWLTRRAERLLEQFFPANARQTTRRLPAEIVQRIGPALRTRAVNAVHTPATTRPLTWQFLGATGRTLTLHVRPSTSQPNHWNLRVEEATATVSARPLVREFNLTPRQAEVLYWLKEGRTNWEIGALLGITEKTTGKHLESIFSKLGVDNRTAAAHLAGAAGVTK